MIVVAAPIQRIVARPAVKRIHPVQLDGSPPHIGVYDFAIRVHARAVPVKLVIPLVPKNHVASGHAPDQILVGAAMHHIVAGAAHYPVIARAAIDDVGVIAAPWGRVYVRNVVDLVAQGIDSPFLVRCPVKSTRQRCPVKCLFWVGGRAFPRGPTKT